MSGEHSQSMLGRGNLPFSLYLKFLLVGTAGETFAKKLRWIWGARQRHLHPELWELHLEEERLPLVLSRLLSANSCAVDVGCHIGSFLRLLEKYAPSGRHIAFEASLTKSAWLKSRFPKSEIQACGVSDHSGTATFLEDISRPGFSHLETQNEVSNATQKGYEVTIRRLDDILLTKDRVDFIKLDIEGGELAALRGAVETFRKFHPAMIFECGPGIEPQDRVRREQLYKFITGDLGYEIFSFSDFVFNKGSLSFDEFRKCGEYPFRAFNFVALWRGRNKI